MWQLHEKLPMRFTQSTGFWFAMSQGSFSHSLSSLQSPSESAENPELHVQVKEPGIFSQLAGLPWDAIWHASAAHSSISFLRLINK